MQYVTLLLAISCVFLLRAFAKENKNKKLWENYYTRTLNMKCKIPQERALLVMQFKDKLVPTISDLKFEKVGRKRDCIIAIVLKIIF